MKKYLCAAVAILILAACFTGCGKKNVSDDPNGRITDPTVETPTMIPEPTVTTLPPPVPPEFPTETMTRPTASNTGSVSPSTGETGGMDTTPGTDNESATGESGMTRPRGKRINPMP